MTKAIYEYSRREAIEDGVLIDVSEAAAELGITYPVAVTSSVWFSVVEVPDDLTGEEDETGRLWSMLTMFRFTARKIDDRWSSFQVSVGREANADSELVTLRAHCGPGDDMEPVITIMFPGED